MALLEKELAHFKHPIAVPGMGVAVQEKLKETRILVVGAGGLGSSVIQYLSASGVGVIGIADYGVINDEDMHRQPLYQMQDIRKHKAKMAASRLWASNPFTKHYPLLLQVKPDNIKQLLQGMDLVIDCSQHVATHLVINDACISEGKPFVIGEVHNWVSWWAGFNIAPVSGDAAASYRCALELIDDHRNFDAGAIGVTHGATGMMMVNEVLKFIAGVPDGLANKFYSMNFLHNTYEVSTLAPNATILADTRAKGVLTAEDYDLEIVPDIED
ncbi:HesA/MoeB/ThiF family protein [Chitinophaga filiformis]|uniref:Adenylyltransferase and sulfurtransferase n=1 Tax=Chitinophaga filiformis TaxID=104663 RepID=A0A1G7GWD3_CHIFI|nr:HesA/MoeB/ThiF family protein [Chitinophaga filiformis]SDE92457.1 adenylyltransferase and sulfurtransferase [Chitinophaga filiformis]